MRIKQFFHKHKSLKKFFVFFGLLLLILIVWSQINIIEAKYAVTAEEKNINFSGRFISQKAIDRGCFHYSGPLDFFEPFSTIFDVTFGLNTECYVDSEKVFFHSGSFNDYKNDVLAADKLLQTQGWKRDDLSGSDIDWKLKEPYVWPIQQTYISINNSEILTLFTFDKNDPLNSTLLFNEDNLIKNIHSDTDYIYGIVVTKNYPTWPNRFFQIYNF